MDKIEVEILNKKKNYLKRYRRVNFQIIRLEEKLAHIDDRLASVGSPTFSDMPRGTSHVSMADRIHEKCELELRINRLVQRARQYRTETLALIDELEDTRVVDVLELFLIDCLTFEEIADELCITVRHVSRVYRRGIELIKCPLSEESTS